MDFSDYLNSSLLFFNVLCNVWSVVGTPNSSKCSERAQGDEQNFIVSIGGKRIARKQFHNN